ncbi:PEP-CTERM sorting domain-containing protein [Haloferula sargassicola]|uniref:PEP-CTERM protein-sorting domain-containing protein n=1 Tax=Haloferula sargassicola TaxID=490096 RepID=A0ABP9UQS5_9BACT
MKLAFILAGLTAVSHAAILLETIDLQSSSQTTTVWTDLSSANATLVPDSGSGSMSVAGGFSASTGLYSFAGDYSATIAQTVGFDIASVVLQVELSPNGAFPYDGGPLLTLTTSLGTEQLAASLYAAGDSELRSGTMGPTTYTAYAWQWDLSSYGDTITSVSLETPFAVHSSVTAARIDVGDSFAPVVVPEPSTALLSLVGMGFILRRRR